MTVETGVTVETVEAKVTVETGVTVESVETGMTVETVDWSDSGDSRLE